MPELFFKGKEFVYNHHLAVPFRPLVPDPSRSVGESGAKGRLDGNLIIHGDNLHALKALLPLYAGRVDCIFIDPPYNTGNEGWCYNDRVNSPMMREWLNSNPVGIEDGLRHDKWLAMMWPRLRLLRELLSEKGSLWVTLDDNELHRARGILGELFGEDNALGVVVVESNPRGRQSEHAIASTHEYLLGFAKDATQAAVSGEVLSTTRLDEYCFVDDMGRRYRTRGLRHRGNASLREERPKMFFPLYVNPDTKRVSLLPSQSYTMEVLPRKSDGRDGRWEWGKQAVADRINDLEGVFVHRRQEWDIAMREYLTLANGEERRAKWVSLWSEREFNYQVGRTELKAMFGSDVFQYPKPSTLLEKIVIGTSPPDGLILDSFAGSGTTAHAVLAANAKDGGNRKFILVECEDYADTLTAERVRRVIRGYDFQGTQREELHREGLTFTSLKKADKLLDHVESIKHLEGHRFDKIKAEVKGGELIVTGEREVTERTEGLGGEFTYCTLGPPLEMDKLLTGEDLPSFEQLGALLFHMATNEARPIEADHEEVAGCGYLGESSARHVWLIYRPDLAFLKSRDAALTLSRAQALAAAKPDKAHLGFLDQPPSAQTSQILQGSSLAWLNNAANAWSRRCMAVAMGRWGALGQPSNSWDRPGRRMRLWTLVKNRATRIPRSVT